MKNIIAAASTLLLLCACGTTHVPAPKNAGFYISEGDTLFEKKLYEEAIASWEKARENFSSADQLILADLKIAEAHFLAGHYPEAAVAYENFLKNHPDHDQASLVLFRLGLSYYRQMLAPDRDQTATRNTLVALTNFQQLFPDDPKADEAATMIKECRSQLAAHEISVGRYYVRTKSYNAAIKRLTSAATTYPDAPELDQAWYYLGMAYLRSNQRNKATEAFNTLFRHYPNSPYIAMGQALLAKEF